MYTKNHCLLEPIVLKMNRFSKKKVNFFVKLLICIFKKYQLTIVSIDHFKSKETFN